MPYRILSYADSNINSAKMAICGGSICLRIEPATVSKKDLYPLLDDTFPNNLKTNYI